MVDFGSEELAGTGFDIIDTDSFVEEICSLIDFSAAFENTAEVVVMMDPLSVDSSKTSSRLSSLALDFGNGD